MPKISAEKLTTELSKGTISPVYLLTGDDVYRKNLVIEQIKKILQPDDFNYYRSDTDKADLAEALAQANTSPVFSDKRLIVLTGLDKLRKDAKGPREALIRYINSPLPSTVLVLTYDDSKKMKTEKLLPQVCADNGKVVNFDELKNEELSAWIRTQLEKRGLHADFQAVDLLAESVGSELAALENEIEKLYLYTAERTDKTISEQDVLACIGFNKEQNPFELANLILACQRQKAVLLIDKLIDDGEEPVAVLAKITFPILKMARIRRLADAGVSPSEIMQTAGLFAWENRLVSNVHRFPSAACFLQTLNRIIDADAGFKSGENLDPKITIKGILLTLFR
jgi:DNA polymerase-3 subunit delta